MHVRLLSLEPSKQTETAKLVVAKGLTVRETEKMVRNINEPNRKRPLKPIKITISSALEQQLAEKIGAQCCD